MKKAGCQIEYVGESIADRLFAVLGQENAVHPFFVVGTAFRQLDLEKKIKERYPHSVFFSDFLPNPSYESAAAGREMFRKNNCDFIVAIGGGSAIDVAKSVKAFAFMDGNGCYLNQKIEENGLRMLAAPTTAGTGSEATHFGVIYHHGGKKSVSHEGLLPNYVILDAGVLEFLPPYQRKATMLDALCHGIESLWSVNSTDESREFASDAVRNIISYKDSYMHNEKEGNLNMLRAANYAGKAINITQTTAAHAMSYKMALMYGIPHGHSAALCLPKVWKYMDSNMDKCIDSRGAEYLRSVFGYICSLLGQLETSDAIEYLDDMIFNELRLDKPVMQSNDDMGELIRSVNAGRLKNSPVFFDSKALEEVYGEILL